MGTKPVLQNHEFHNLAGSISNEHLEAAEALGRYMAAKYDLLPEQLGSFVNSSRNTTAAGAFMKGVAHITEQEALRPPVSQASPQQARAARAAAFRAVKPRPVR